MNTAPTNPATNDGFDLQAPRYTIRHSFEAGDRVIVRICEVTIATWRHGTVSDMTRYPIRAEAHGQFSYPVEYPSKGLLDRGWFNPAQQEILYDNHPWNSEEGRWGWQ